MTIGSEVGPNAGIVIGAVDENNGYIYNVSSRSLFKKVAGVISAVPSMPGGTAAAAGDGFRVVKSGASFTAYQNGAEIGSIDDDASVVGGDRAGMFSPAGITRFESFVLA